MLKILFFFILVIEIVVVQSSNNTICMKTYKKKLCLKLSVKNYDVCLFQKFGVFEVNNNFCVTNTKCVPKKSNCLGLLFNNTLWKIVFLKKTELNNANVINT